MVDTPLEHHEEPDPAERPLPDAEEESFEVSDTAEPVPPIDIVAYNEVRSCADLFRLYASGKMEVQPDFQREVVWKKSERTRFIDSLVKQLPIPSMCFSLDPKSQRWKVIDGLQRMTSIIDFLGSEEWRLDTLDDIHPLLKGNSNVALREGEEQYKILYSSVENVTVPVTVIRCDYGMQEHMRYLFTIFHRLNSGGIRLNNQEIRNCIYTGNFNTMLKKVDTQNVDWQVVKAKIWGSVTRFRSVEVLLRVLAFAEERQNYDGNLADFLNRYMFARAAMSEDDCNAVALTLAEAARHARAALENTPGKRSLAIVEAVLVGVKINHDALANAGDGVLGERFEAMLQQAPFAEGARYAVSSAENVNARLTAAIQSFGGPAV